MIRVDNRFITFDELHVGPVSVGNMRSFAMKGGGTMLVGPSLWNHRQVVARRGKRMVWHGLYRAYWPLVVSRNPL